MIPCQCREVARMQCLEAVVIVRQMLQSLNHLSDPLLVLLQCVYVCLLLENTELDTVVQVWPRLC